MTAKGYPRIKVRKLPYADGSQAWTVLLMAGPASAVKHWRCFDWHHVGLVASAIWPERGNWLPSRTAS